MNVPSKLIAAALATILALGSMNTTALAKDMTDEVSNQDNATIISVAKSESDIMPMAAWTYEVNPYRRTLVYTGTGAATTIGITSSSGPVSITIAMVDYNGNTVWTAKDTFATSQRKTWHIGANVKYVYLQGGPCTVSIDTPLIPPARM